MSQIEKLKNVFQLFNLILYKDELLRGTHSSSFYKQQFCKLHLSIKWQKWLDCHEHCCLGKAFIIPPVNVISWIFSANILHIAVVFLGTRAEMHFESCALTIINWIMRTTESQFYWPRLCNTYTTNMPENYEV